MWDVSATETLWVRPPGSVVFNPGPAVLTFSAPSSKFEAIYSALFPNGTQSGKALLTTSVGSVPLDPTVTILTSRGPSGAYTLSPKGLFTPVEDSGIWRALLDGKVVSYCCSFDMLPLLCFAVSVCSCYPGSTCPGSPAPGAR